ncbi:MAG: hypothetical protein J5492_01135, partial [Oxalobacter sp.]|nr:hypothetical protein [Oxalobacter sp.]
MQTGSGDITLSGRVNAHEDIEAAVAGKGDINFDGEVYSDSQINARVGGEGNIEFQLDAYAAGDLNVQTADGDILFYGDSTSGAVVTALASRGNVMVEGNVEATSGDITLMVKDSAQGVADGNILVAKGQLTAGNGSIHLVTQNGDILTGEGIDISAAEDIEIIAKGTDVVTGADGRVEETGVSIDLDGKLTAGRDLTVYVGGLDIYAKGTIDVKGDVTAGHHIETAVFGDGDIRYTGTVQAKEGDVVTFVSGSGNIYYNGDIDAGEDVIDGIGRDGNITVEGNVRANGGQIWANTFGEGSMTFNGDDVSADKDVVVLATIGDISVKQAITADQGDVFLTTMKGNVAVGEDIYAGLSNTDPDSDRGNVAIIISEQGDISVGDDIHAKNDIDLYTADGTISIVGNTESEHGDISISAASNRYDKDTAGAIVINSGSAITAKEGDVNLDATNGDIHVTEEITAGSAGLADKNFSIPNNPAFSYQTASGTKGFTAAAVLSLA